MFERRQSGELDNLAGKLSQKMLGLGSGKTALSVLLKSLIFQVDPESRIKFLFF